MSNAVAVPSTDVTETPGFRLRIAGTTRAGPPRDWIEALDGFTRRNAGRRVTLETDACGPGRRVIGRGYRLTGVTYDPYDRRVGVMLAGEGGARVHLMHAVPRVESIAMAADERGNELLELQHGGNATLLWVQPG